MTTTAEATISVMPRRPKVPGEVFVVVRDENGRLRRWPRSRGGEFASYSDGLLSILGELQGDLYWLTLRAAAAHPDELRLVARVYQHVASAAHLLGGRPPARIPETKAEGARALRGFVSGLLQGHRRDLQAVAPAVALAFVGPFPEWATLHNVLPARPHDHEKIEAIISPLLTELQHSTAQRGYGPNDADAQQLIDRTLKALGVGRSLRKGLFDADARKLRAGRGVKKRATAPARSARST